MYIYKGKLKIELNTDLAKLRLEIKQLRDLKQKIIKY